MSRPQLKPKRGPPKINSITLSSVVFSDPLPPVSSIDVMQRTDSEHSCDSSYCSQDEVGGTVISSVMNTHRHHHHQQSSNTLPRNNISSVTRISSSISLLREQREDETRRHEEEWATLLHKTPPLTLPDPVISAPPAAANPFASASPATTNAISSDDNNGEQQVVVQNNNTQFPKSILRRRLSSSSLERYQDHAKHQQQELQSILQTLEDLQNNFVSNDNSSTSPQNNPAIRKEFAVRHFPNGDLFSGNVCCETGELIYGRMTCALEMEVYEGPFSNGRRHGEGAVCSKMDGGAKFLGR